MLLKSAKERTQFHDYKLYLTEALYKQKVSISHWLYSLKTENRSHCEKTGSSCHAEQLEFREMASRGLITLFFWEKS